MRLWIALIAAALTLGASAPETKEGPKMMHAKGEFEVKLVPLQDDMPDKMGRMSLDKKFTGDLVGTGRGQMISGMGEVEGSGVYVAVERVSGTIGERTGTFLLYHQGVMTRGTPNLKVLVVPDSGTGDFKGITGTLNINIAADGKHFYDFEYAL